METILTLVLLVLANLIVFGVCWWNYHRGHKDGIKEENKRCQNILVTALQVRGSPSTQQALICIAGNQSKEQMISFLEDCNTYAEQQKQKQGIDYGNR